MEVGVPTLPGRPALKTVVEEHRPEPEPALILLLLTEEIAALGLLHRLGPVIPTPANFQVKKND